jgi:molybdopterin converting factor small subunit
MVKNIVLGSAAFLAFAVGIFVLSPKPHPGEGATNESPSATSERGNSSIGAPVPSASPNEVSVRVVYFGMPSDFTGTKQETVTLPSPASLSSLKVSLTAMHPALKGMFPSMLILVDGVSVAGNPPLRDECEVDILAATAGG